MNAAAIRVAEVAANRILCDEHLRLTLHVRERIAAAPGQFVHLCPLSETTVATVEAGAPEAPAPLAMPLLRRAFSIASLTAAADGCDFDVIYRVVGAGTRWMASLRAGDQVSVLGPLGNRFPIADDLREAWLVAGGVGLPPMLWQAEALASAGVATIAFCGARSANLLPLSIVDAEAAADGCPKPIAREFAEHGVSTVIATDDGSLGFAGHVGAAVAAHFDRARPDVNALAVYTCGPERMMHFVAEFCAARGIRCYACVEQAMACGTGMCQSCVVPVHDEAAPDAWRYALCCTEGPVFDATRIKWT